MRRAVIYTDGASSGNPGPSGIGVHITFDGQSIEIAEHIGTATNNIAEYSALLRALEEAVSLGADSVEVYMDSELAVKQVNGLYKVKNQGLKPIYMKVIKLLKQFKSHKISHVPREENTLADKLSKEGTNPDLAKMPSKSPGSPGGNPGNTQGSLF